MAEEELDALFSMPIAEEEKQQVERGKLLVADLCARLPYKEKKQKMDEPDTTYELYSINIETLEICFWKYNGKSLNIADSDKLYRFGTQRYKPYLRPMSSMTEDEFKELKKIYQDQSICSYHTISMDLEFINWYLAHHFDINYLIQSGLAIEVTENNNPYKE